MLGGVVNVVHVRVDVAEGIVDVGLVGDPPGIVGKVLHGEVEHLQRLLVFAVVGIERGKPPRLRRSRSFGCGRRQ